MKIKVEVEFEVNERDWYDKNDQDQKDWFLDIIANSSVMLWSQEVGDYISEVEDINFEIM